MNKILLLIEQKENCRLLSKWLATRYEIISCNDITGEQCAAFLLEQSFDLCILDGQALDRFWQSVQAKRQSEQPTFLPFLLVTSRQDVGMVTRHLWQSVDELIISPIEKVELQARLEILLRSRQYSKQLKLAIEQLQSEIVERQRIEAALAMSEAKYRALVHNSSDVITVVATDGTIEYQCPASPNVLGFSAEEMEGENLSEFVHPDDLASAIAPLTASVANPGATQVSEYRFRHKDGSWRYLESKSNFSPANLSLPGIVVNSRDITERKQAEQDILNTLKKEQDLNALKSHFVSMVAHDFRNPLNGISAAAQLLERYGEQWSTEKKQEFFGRIKTEVKRMTALLDDVLVIGKADTKGLEVKPAPLNLEEFSRDLIEEIELSTGNQHKIIFTCLGQCTHVRLDAKLLRQVLTNLLTNAIKYSPESSTVHFDLICQNGEAQFQIQDQGIGIPPEDRERLFETFYRATNVKNIPGTGLGLAIVKKYVDLQGGKIAVNSEVGVGTTFTVTLPLHTKV